MRSSPKSIWQGFRGIFVISRKHLCFIISAVFCFSSDTSDVINRMRRPAKTDFAPAHIPDPKMWFFVINPFLNVHLLKAIPAVQTCR